jgi:hypothetical protein
MYYPEPVRKDEAMSKKKSENKSLSSWLRRRNWGNIIAALALALSLINLYHTLNPPPQRAKLTIFIEDAIPHSFSANELNFQIWGKVVNDSPITALIRRWGLVLNVNMSYTIVSSMFSMPDLSLSPSEQVNYTMGHVLIGDNGTSIPETAIRSCMAWLEYEDAVGLQFAQKEFRFL